MTRTINWKTEYFDGMLKIDGFDDACIGFASRCSCKDVLAYSTEKIIEILMQRDGMDYEEAWEFFDFNIGGAWLGEGTPYFISSLPEEVIDGE